MKGGQRITAFGAVLLSPTPFTKKFGSLPRRNCLTPLWSDLVCGHDYVARPNTIKMVLFCLLLFYTVVITVHYLNVHSRKYSDHKINMKENRLYGLCSVCTITSPARGRRLPITIGGVEGGVAPVVIPTCGKRATEGSLVSVCGEVNNGSLLKSTYD